MNLNDTQEGLLNLVFKVADDRGWHILDLKDLRSMLKHVSDHASEYRTQYGNVSAASIGAIQRQLLTLENEAQKNSSANLPSTCKTGCKPTTAKASSTSLIPKN